MRVGIVGVGSMGSIHAAGWAETPAKIAGFLHRTEAGARPLADMCTPTWMPSWPT
jgi:predicted dehydrogenase